ncbi:integrase, catalytic region, zinc finger, CCHC-type containing protein [Tanacetum coccineum]
MLHSTLPSLTLWLKDKDLPLDALTGKKELFLENDRLLQKIMSQDVLLSVMSSITLTGESVNVNMQIRLKCSTSTCRSKPTCNKKNDRISQPQSSNMKNKVEAQHRRVTLNSNKKIHVVEPIRDADVKHSLLNVNSELICATCNQCMFDANHDMCALDFVKNVNGCSKSAKKHKKQNIWKPMGHVFIEVGFKWKQQERLSTFSCNSCPLNSKKSSHQPKAEDTNQEKLYLLHMDLCGPMRVKSINGKKYILVIVDDYSRFTWVKFLRSKDEAPDVIIKCIKNIQVRLNATIRNNRSLIRLYSKNPYELMHDKKPNLSFLHVCSSLCYPTNNSEDLGKLNAKADIGLVPNPIPQQPYNPPNRDDWDHLFQPIFDEYFNPPTIVVSPVPVDAAPRAVDIADSHVSMSIDQDAPSTSIPSTQEQEHSTIISQGVEESPKTPQFHDDPLHESLHEDSTSQGSSSNVRPSHTPFELISRWTEDHPIANVIGDPSRSVSTRKQL